MKYIDIIVPCYNEQDCISKFYTEVENVTQALRDNYTCSFYFIDDGSIDNTYNIIKELSLYHNNIKYISFSRNFGKEAAIFAGLKNSSGDLAVLMDVDLQDPPKLIPEMLKAIEDGYDMATAYRTSRKGEPPIRSWFAERFYQLINSISDIEIKSGARDFRLITRNIIDACVSLNEYERFSKGLFQWVGFKNKWINYDNIERVAGSSKWSFWKLVKYAISGIVAFSTVPLRIASFIGLSTVLLAILYLIYRIARYGINISTEIVTIELIIVLSGIIIFLLGIIGEYLSKIYLEIKRRPIYIVKDKNF